MRLFSNFCHHHKEEAAAVTRKNGPNIKANTQISPFLRTKGGTSSDSSTWRCDLSSGAAVQ